MSSSPAIGQKPATTAGVSIGFSKRHTSTRAHGRSPALVLGKTAAPRQHGAAQDALVRHAGS
jgi:hypothetical protein